MRIIHVYYIRVSYTRKDLKILLDHQNNFIEISKIMSGAEKNFDILATGLNVLHNYFDSSTKLPF